MTDPLTIAVTRLVGQVGHWTPARWTKPGAAGGISRAEAVHALVQRLADTAANASGEPCRPVPRLDNDLALVDQVRVVAADAVAVLPPDRLERSAEEVRTVAASL